MVPLFDPGRSTARELAIALLRCPMPDYSLLADCFRRERFFALGLADHLDTARQKALLTEAIGDEPEPELRKEMARSLRRLRVD